MCWNGCGREGGEGVEAVSHSLRETKHFAENRKILKVQLARSCHADVFYRAHPYEEPAYEVYKIEDF